MTILSIFSSQEDTVIVIRIKKTRKYHNKIATSSPFRSIRNSKEPLTLTVLEWLIKRWKSVNLTKSHQIRNSVILQGIHHYHAIMELGGVVKWTTAPCWSQKPTGKGTQTWSKDVIKVNMEIRSLGRPTKTQKEGMCTYPPQRCGKY